MVLKRLTRNSRTYFFFLLFVIEITGIALFYFSDAGVAKLTSDMTAVMQLVEKSLEERTLLPKNWYYTNTIGFPTIFSFMVLVFWLTKSRIITIMITNILQLILMLCAEYFFAKKILGLEFDKCIICLIICASPISNLYIMEMFFVGYTWRLFMWFFLLVLGMLSIRDVELKLSGKYLVMYNLFLFLFMTGDLRYLATLVLPIFVSIVGWYLLENSNQKLIWNKTTWIGIKNFIIYVGTVLGTTICCKVAEVFIKRDRAFIPGYYAQQVTVDRFIDRLHSLIIEWIRGFGFIEGGTLISFHTILSFFSLCFLIYICLINPILMLKSYRDHTFFVQRVILFRWTGYLVSIFFCIFADGLTFRHLLTYIVLDIFLFVYYIDKYAIKKNTLIKFLGWFVLVFYIILNWLYIPISFSAENLEKRENIISLIEKNNLKYGYAPYWTASVTDTISEGALKIYPWEISGRYEWYAPIDLYLPSIENEKTFLLFTKEDYNNIIQDVNFERIYGDYVKKITKYGYVVLIYDYNIAQNFTDSDCVLNHNLLKELSCSYIDERNTSYVIYLPQNEYVYGPYISLDQGTYNVVVTLSKEADFEIYTISGNKKITFVKKKLRKGENEVVLSIDEITPNMEFNITNSESESELEITELSVERVD